MVGNFSSVAVNFTEASACIDTPGDPWVYENVCLLLIVDEHASPGLVGPAAEFLWQYPMWVQA